MLITEHLYLRNMGSRFVSSYQVTSARPLSNGSTRSLSKLMKRQISIKVCFNSLFSNPRALQQHSQALDHKRTEPNDVEDMSKLTSENMDAEYREPTLNRLEALNEQGPTCAITEPLSGEPLCTLPSIDGGRTIPARGYALGYRGTLLSHLRFSMSPCVLSRTHRVSSGSCSTCSH